MTRRNRRRSSQQNEVVLLVDLAPKHDVRGGAGRVLFGQILSTTEPSSPATSMVNDADKAAPTSVDMLIRRRSP